MDITDVYCEHTAECGPDVRAHEFLKVIDNKEGRFRIVFCEECTFALFAQLLQWFLDKTFRNSITQAISWAYQPQRDLPWQQT